MDAAGWDDLYNSKDTLWSGKPNPVLVAEAVDLQPGRALDVGCGEGADALWLAAHDWTVTAIDISAVALQRAAQHASDAQAEIRWRQADVTAEAPPEGPYDLVTAQYFHVGPDAMPSTLRRLASAVAPGGTLLVVGHHGADLEQNENGHGHGHGQEDGQEQRRGPDLSLCFLPEDISDTLDRTEWRIVVSELRATAGHLHDVRDVVVRAQRLP
jgi:SAM-dependent methyltransferase